MIAKFNQEKYLNDWKTEHRRYERSQYQNFKQALDKQIHPVVQFIKSNGVYNLEMHLTVLVSAQPMKIAYEKCYMKIGVQHAGWIYNRIEKIATQKDIPSFFSEKWRKLMSLFYHTDGGQRITQVTDTTRETIIQLLDESQNLPLSERANYIVDKLDDPDFNRTRALRIARTESTTAANQGALLGADGSDYQTNKMWLAVLDANTRPAHVTANGETVALDETFLVGGESLAFPGDPAGSAKNIINCRCALAIIPVIGENGLPILKRAA